ncbi:Dihydropyrimidinase-related protein 2 [Strongyloides ratti]|uniref:dihydropyrimidinase n=1 Tax=Strongyloides ratti TaxID=34506 RepID=A0A090KQ52_STRRB|nr:Dihydropyrimidinase-related protein 2 [Strongyloides ratti]CEF59653.1 Dihydropyrimidinase-related protein 2 [Strongyloides ratti]
MSSNKILIKNGTIVNDDLIKKADVLINNGIIIAIEDNIEIKNEQVEIIDAKDKLVIPGGIDPHTHMEMPFMGQVAVDDFFTGTRAAVSGGTTMIIDFVVPTKNASLIEAYHTWRSWADPKVVCDYGLSMCVTWWSDKVAEEMTKLTSPEYGINSFKFFLAYKNSLMVDDGEFYKGLKHCSKIKALARVHAENGHIIDEKQKELLEYGITGPEGHIQSRPEEIEAEAVNRACCLADQANCPLYVVHVMSKGAADEIATARMNGQVVFGEPIAAGLALDGKVYYNKDWEMAARYVMSPPLSRKEETKVELMKMLASGQLQLTATDNCTFNCQQKKVGLNDFTKIPNGINGVEDRMSIVWEKGVESGLIDAMKFVSITSSEAAKIFNIYPKKGRISVGSDADIVIWNPHKTRTISASTHHHNLKTNVFEGMIVHGVPEITISRGNIVWKEEKLYIEPGSGKFIPLLPNCNHVFGTMNKKANTKKPISINRNI